MLFLERLKKQETEGTDWKEASRAQDRRAAMPLRSSIEQILDELHLGASP